MTHLIPAWKGSRSLQGCEQQAREPEQREGRGTAALPPATRSQTGKVCGIAGTKEPGRGVRAEKGKNGTEILRYKKDQVLSSAQAA